MILHKGSVGSKMGLIITETLCGLGCVTTRAFYVMFRGFVG